MQKPTGKSTAPRSGDPVWTVTVTANTADSASRAPAISARISVSRVDMKIFASPASTIFATNSDGARYAIAVAPEVGIEAVFLTRSTARKFGNYDSLAASRP